MENKKELKVSAIENGTVIDHIPQGTVLKVIKILNLEDHNDQIYLGANLDSKKFGKKGIIKVSNRFFDEDEINKISLVAPTASIIEIKNYEVTKKAKVRIPDHITQFVKCVNPKCVTNNQNVSTNFKVIDKTEIRLLCHYCEKITKKGSIHFQN